MEVDVEEVSELFHTAADVRRRRAVECLARHGSLALPDLADELAVAEHDAPLAAVDPETVKRLYLDLYHSHVPVLEERDLVRYDQAGDRVAITDRGERFGAWLDDAVSSLPP